ncbi:MAG: guanylate kinase, partial [Pseudomonadota bacterium]|nr:guanylate kinase [Pseudomonadota bacterium]
TTRPSRPGEENEKDYFFIDNNLFGKMKKDGEFLEYAKVFGSYYATPKKPVQRALESGFDVLFDIDWQGTQQLMDSMHEDLVKVFVLPPSVEELEKRLHNRKQDNDNVIKERMSRAADEISHYAEYDYIIVNDNFEDSLKIIHSIIIAERYKRQRQISALSIIKNLRNSL